MEELKKHILTALKENESKLETDEQVEVFFNHLREIVNSFSDKFNEDIKKELSENMILFKEGPFFHHFFRDILNMEYYYKESLMEHPALSNGRPIPISALDSFKKIAKTHIEEYLKVMKDYLDDGYVKMYPVYASHGSAVPVWHIWYRNDFYKFTKKIGE